MAATSSASSALDRRVGSNSGSRNSPHGEMIGELLVLIDGHEAVEGQDARRPEAAFQLGDERFRRGELGARMSIVLLLVLGSRVEIVERHDRFGLGAVQVQRIEVEAQMREQRRPSQGHRPSVR